MRDRAWSCAVGRGRARSCAVVRGRARSCVVGRARSCVVVCGRARSVVRGHAVVPFCPLRGQHCRGTNERTTSNNPLKPPGVGWVNLFVCLR